jgi:hypothetical protein
MRKLTVQRLMIMSATLGLANNGAFAQSPNAGDARGAQDLVEGLDAHTRSFVLSAGRCA